MSTGKDEQAIAGWITKALADVLGVSPAQIDPRRPFSYYGLGSTETVMIVGDLEAWLGASLPSSLAFDFPNIRSLSRHLAGNLEAYAVAEAS